MRKAPGPSGVRPDAGPRGTRDRGLVSVFLSKPLRELDGAARPCRFRAAVGATSPHGRPVNAEVGRSHPRSLPWCVSWGTTATRGREPKTVRGPACPPARGEPNRAVATAHPSPGFLAWRGVRDSRSGNPGACLVPGLRATSIGRMVEPRVTAAVSGARPREGVQSRPAGASPCRPTTGSLLGGLQCWGGTMVALSHVRFGKRNDEVKATQKALIVVGADIPAGATGFFGEQTRSSYAAWQRMLGLTGSAADGFPGCSSLTELGAGCGSVVDCHHPGTIAKSSVRFSKHSGVAVGEATARTFAEQACDRPGAVGRCQAQLLTRLRPSDSRDVRREPPGGHIRPHLRPGGEHRRGNQLHLAPVRGHLARSTGEPAS